MGTLPSNEKGRQKAPFLLRPAGSGDEEATYRPQAGLALETQEMRRT
jgi:hypothetical protein